MCTILFKCILYDLLQFIENNPTVCAILNQISIKCLINTTFKAEIVKTHVAMMNPKFNTGFRLFL